MKRGNSKEESSRPVSWCVGGCQLNESNFFLNSFNDTKENEEIRKDELQHNLKENSPLPRGVLVRSTSYQALHSALARLYRLDDFTLERIGQGFFSEVYKARHLVTGKIMVLKMNKLFSNRHNMLREVELMNRLHHPNILNYYGVCVHEGQVHALTQYINGGSLDALLQNLRIDLAWLTRASLALDIARGMAYLHSKRVFHRDLTSKNILIKHSKEKGKHRLRAVIADFGLAAPIPQDKSVRLRQVGSPYWMAPEVIRGEWYDHRVDIFSFGIIVCEIIARCDADPDVLPRTHNFGVHYLAFSRMCQSDCPPTLLEMAFQCCQIDPDSRPSFKELETLLFYFIGDNRPAVSPRKQKVYHRRSLSDDSFILMRNHMHEGTAKDSSSPGAVTPGTPGTPQEVLERISAADPYFQPSTATVNPFSSVKLPAKSQLIVQDGGRYCHSMPADLRNTQLCHGSTVTLSPSAHLTTSDTSLSQGVSPTHYSSCKCSCNNCNNNSQAVSDTCSHSQCSCKSSQSCKKKSEKFFDECKCSSSSGATEHSRSFVSKTSTRLFPGSWLQDTFHSSGTCPRSDAGGGALNQAPVGGAVRRRGSGESGFFSVEDELCLSYSELSSASFLSTEDDENFGSHPLTIHRSPSVVTDSSEDLSSIGCGHDLTYDLASLSDYDHAAPHCFNPEGTTDIKSIVEFFERGYGSLRSLTESERNRKLAASARRKECLVPFLRSRFNAGLNHRSLSGALSKVPNGGIVAQGSASKSCTKDKCRFGCGRGNLDKTLRGKDRPKVYITEGTVRAKRDIFESK